MADEQQEIYDSPQERSEKDLERLGLPGWSFSSLLDNAIEHAGDPARADALVRPWMPSGPRNVGGRIRCIAQDVKNPNTIYAGSGFGGVWKTENAGDTWRPLDRFQQAAPAVNVRQALPIGAIGVGVTNPLILYVGTGEGVRFNAGSDTDHYPGSGLYQSTDGGTTFNQIDHVSTGVIKSNRYEKIIVDPWDDNRCWLATSKGMWRREGGPPAAITQDVIDAASAGAAASQVVTDILIAFGDPLAPAAPARSTIYVALYGKGLYKATFDRAGKNYVTPSPGAPKWTQLTEGIKEQNLGRIKIGLCRNHPDVLYALFGHSSPDKSINHTVSRVYRSADSGQSWEKTSGPEDDSKQAFWDLALEVHPDNPAIVATGTVDVYRTTNSGETWERIINWKNYDLWDRAQHADQHAIMFDLLDPRKLWVCNDGGISMSRNLGVNWRKRSHGILCAQFVDMAIHPVFPYLTGGGMQDNGTWLGYGGPSWYRLFGADGGAMAFDPTSSQLFYITWQGPRDDRHHGLVQINVANPPVDINSSNTIKNLNAMPDLPPVAAVAPRYRVMRPADTDLLTGFGAGHTAPFVGVLEHHPAVASDLLVGRFLSAYRGTMVGGGLSFTQLTTGPFGGGTPHASTVAYSPSSPNTHWWVGTSDGLVFFTTNSGGLWNPVALPNLAAVEITDIVVHPTQPQIVAISTGGNPGRVYLTGDNGTTWIEVSGRAAPAGPTPGPTSPATDTLCPTPIVCLCWDPQTDSTAANPQTLYAGTLAGVYVCRNLVAPTVWPPAPPPPPFPNPVWRTFNRDLPLVLVEDLKAYVVRDNVGNVARTGLRVATHGRGMFECDLAARQEVRLLIRDTIIDDGFPYFGVQAMANDPRVVAALPLTSTQSVDIRIDAPPFSFFEETLDGAEFDEMLFNDIPVADERNMVYIQLHQTGTRGTVNDSFVHLYAADVTGGGAPPALDAGFWDSFPGATAAAATWKKVGQAGPIRELEPGQPRVVRIEWTPPITAGAAPQFALLALATHVDDDLRAAGPTLDVNALVPAERRAAMFITNVTPTSPDVMVRDGLDDLGPSGAVAWGGRSLDIAVVPAALGSPETAMPNLADLRSTDAVLADTSNFIYVRVHNRRSSPLTADVKLYMIPQDTPHDSTTWTQIGGAVQAVDVPAKSWKFAAVIQWDNPPDPAPAAPADENRYVVLAAIISRDGDPEPNIAAITNLDQFWRFFRDSNNATLRGLPYRK